jgi:hypothetical protein
MAYWFVCILCTQDAPAATKPPGENGGYTEHDRIESRLWRASRGHPDRTIHR